LITHGSYPAGRASLHGDNDGKQQKNRNGVKDDARFQGKPLDVQSANDQEHSKRQSRMASDDRQVSYD
jgi:hypothetical protein